MRYRQIKPTKKRRRKLLKPPVFDGEAKTAIALAFAGLDGVDGLIKWAKLNTHNRGMFYSLFGKLIPLTMNTKSDVNVNATLNVKEDGEAMSKAMVDALARVIAVRRRDEPERAASAGITMLDGETYTDALERTIAQRDGVVFRDVCTAVIMDNVSQDATAASGRRPLIDITPQPRVAPREAVKPASPAATPRNTEPLRIVHSDIPGLYAGSVLDEGADDRSTTQKFYDYHAREKPP
jgi:hypothetical protein